jgi:hypothetical protein
MHIIMWLVLVCTHSQLHPDPSVQHIHAHYHVTGACVQKRNIENSDMPVNNEEQLYCIVQQRQMEDLRFHSYASYWLFISMAMELDILQFNVADCSWMLPDKRNRLLWNGVL